MSEKTPSAADLSAQGETFANDYHWRSTKAKQQLRDRFGRWISLGANVRFRGEGQEQSGVVTSVINGKAYVDQKNLDGTVTQKIIDPSAIRVIASKATLPPNGSKINDPKNNFAGAIKSEEFKKALADNGQATIQRADGYALAANLVDKAQGLDNKAQGGDNQVLDGTEAIHDKVTGNPIAYQLFAPGGRSLGQYTQAAEGDFDAMVAEDQGATPSTPSKADTSPTGGEAAPAETAVAASVEVVGEEKPFRVPSAVKEEISSTIASLSVDLPESELSAANRLANDDTVSLSDVQWVHGFFADNEVSEKLRGGFKGRQWASKIVAAGGIPVIDEIVVESHPKYLFDDDIWAYFAVGSVPGSTLVNKLLSVDYESGDVFAWTPEGFQILPGIDMKEIDEPQIIPIDEMTADEFAHWLDSGVAEEFDILDTNPEERNLFTLADSEIDYDELDKAYAILATAGDGMYSPIERSQNAKAQARGAGGRFGSGGAGSDPKAVGPGAPAQTTPAGQGPAGVPQDGAQASPDGSDAPRVKKAQLPMELPLVEDPAARIADFISTAAEAPVVAAGETPEYTEEDQAAEDAATGPTDEALYFAIVDEVDKAAVLDAVAIVKQNGQPSAFVRKDGAWVADPGTLTILQGSTPPAVVELPDPATVKNVIEQIDAHDSGADQTEVSEDMAPKPGEVAVAASGFALSDGSYTIIDVEDLEEAVVASGAQPDLFVKAHIRKRARALNRMDLVPSEWREFSLAEIGEISASKALYGEYGEILVAAGVPGIADTPSDFRNVAKLQNYWTHGKGALKIRWGTKGDLTRAHRHLAKYVGPQRAWGLAQKYHRSIFGVYNHTHDVATGQYVPRRRKKK